MTYLRDLELRVRTYNDIKARAAMALDPDMLDEARRLYDDVRAAGLLDRGSLKNLSTALDNHRRLHAAGALDQAALSRVAEAMILYNELQAAGATGDVIETLRDAVDVYSAVADVVQQEASAARDLDDVLDLFRDAVARRERAVGKQDVEADEEGNDPSAPATMPRSTEELDVAAEFAAETIVLREDASPRLVRLLEVGEQFGHALDLACAEGTDEPWIQGALDEAGKEFRSVVAETAAWLAEIDQDPPPE